MPRHHAVNCLGCGRDTSSLSELCAPCSMPGIAQFSDQTGRHSDYEGQNGRGAYDGDSANEFDEYSARDSRDDSHLSSPEPVAGDQFDPVLRAFAVEDSEAMFEEQLEEGMREAEERGTFEATAPDALTEPDWDEVFAHQYQDFEDEPVEYDAGNAGEIDIEDMLGVEEAPVISHGKRGHRKGDPGIGGNRHRPGRRKV